MIVTGQQDKFIAWSLWPVKHLGLKLGKFMLQFRKRLRESFDNAWVDVTNDTVIRSTKILGSWKNWNPFLIKVMMPQFNPRFKCSIVNNILIFTIQFLQFVSFFFIVINVDCKNAKMGKHRIYSVDLWYENRYQTLIKKMGTGSDLKNWHW